MRQILRVSLSIESDGGKCMVAAPRRRFPADRGPGSANDGGQAGVGGQVFCGVNVRAVRDDGEELGGGPETDAGYRAQGRGKRVGL